MSDRSLVLVLSNDQSVAAAKTSRHLTLALNQIGYNAITRDTRLLRWAAGEVEAESAMRREAYETLVVTKWNRFVFDYGVNMIVSVDLHWLFSGQLFLHDAQLQAVHSFWMNDLRSHLRGSTMFPLGPLPALELINTPKVSHHCPSSAQEEEMRMLGVKHVLPSAPAAPEEYLRADEPCTEQHKLAFLGDPGLAIPPTAQALAAMDRGEKLAALRELARKEILAELAVNEPTASWVKQAPGVIDLIAAATELRLAQPHTPAISLLTLAGRSYPEAFDFLHRGGLILDAALLVKFVNRYDRPALVRRFWKRGWLDVFGAPEPWSLYGVRARPAVPSPQEASIFRRYAGHLNVAKCTRDAAVDEKLFEIAACARLSLNLDNPEVRASYATDEVVLADSDEALEAAAEELLRDPATALAKGEKARERTAKEHLWEHRLKQALG